jgi:hypothetical protein
VKTLRSALFLLLWIAIPVFAHSVGTSYIRIDGAALRVDLALRDLEFAIGLDANNDGAITWGEVSAQTPELQRYVLQHLAITRADTHCRLSPADVLIDQHQDGAYAVLPFNLTCAGGTPVHVHSNMLFDTDAAHRTLLNINDGEHVDTAVLTADRRDWNTSQQHDGHWRSFAAFMQQGIWHIWQGFDHLAFLLLLLLPAVLHPDRPASPSLWLRVVRIVTAFTAAHSLTLSLAALGQIQLPSRAVEMAIAASVIIAGLGNLHPRTRHLGAATAFVFGLVHGFGFASALAGLELNTGARILPLLGFNLGVEVGQLAVVALVLPLLYRGGDSTFYLRRLMPTASLGIAAVGLLWFVQRALA